MLHVYYIYTHIFGTSFRLREQWFVVAYWNSYNYHSIQFLAVYQWILYLWCGGFNLPLPLCCKPAVSHNLLTYNNHIIFISTCICEMGSTSGSDMCCGVNNWTEVSFLYTLSPVGFMWNGSWWYSEDVDFTQRYLRRTWYTL